MEFKQRPLIQLTHHLDDGAVLIDDNHIERQIKPLAMGRKAWMFVAAKWPGNALRWL